MVTPESLERGILQQPEPDEKAFAHVGMRVVWAGLGVDETGNDARSGRILVKVDPRYFRPTEVDLLIGDASKARAKLGWQHKVSFDEIGAEMVTADLKTVTDERSRVLTFAD